MPGAGHRFLPHSPHSTYVHSHSPHSMYIHTHHTQPMYMKLWDQTKLTKKKNKFVICHMVCQLQTQYFQMSHIQFSSISGASCANQYTQATNIFNQNIHDSKVQKQKLHTERGAKDQGGSQGWSTKGSNRGKRAPNVRHHTSGVLNDTLAWETAAIGGALSAYNANADENKGFPKSDPGPYPSQLRTPRFASRKRAQIE